MCKCFARCEADCVCDHDWTPPELTAARETITALEAERSRLRAELTHEKCLREQAEALCVVLRAHREEYAAQGAEGRAEIADITADNKRLRAELAEATAWRPISTAPTEGRILLWRAHATAPIVAKFDAIYGEFEDAFGDHVYGGTHWMPLPKAPKTGECIDAAMAGGEHGDA